LGSILVYHDNVGQKVLRRLVIAGKAKQARRGRKSRKNGSIEAVPREKIKE